jgi:hypothetical protein
LAISTQVSSLPHFRKYHRVAGAIDGLPRWKAFGQIPPDNAIFGQVKDGFYNRFEGPDAFSFDTNEFFNTLPQRRLPGEGPSGRRNMIVARN